MEDLRYARPKSLRLVALHPEIVSFIRAQATQVSVSPAQVNQAITDYLVAHPAQVKKAVHLDNQPTGYVLNHGLGTLLGVTMNQYCLELRFQDGSGNPVVGISFTKNTTDQATLTFSDSSYVFTGDLIAEATKF